MKPILPALVLAALLPLAPLAAAGYTRLVPLPAPKVIASAEEYPGGSYRAGNLVDGDHMLGVLGRHLHATGRLLAQTIVTTNMRNTGLKNFVATQGITMEETPVGDKYVIERLMELRKQAPPSGAIGLGGEQAGHIVLLDDDHFTGDGIRTALFFARAFRESGCTTLAAFAAEVGKTPQIIASAPVGELPRKIGRAHV